MHLDLTDEEARALARHLRDALDYSRYPFAPRRDPLKAILAKLDPPKPRPATVAAAASERRPPRRARSAAVRSNAHTHGRKPKLTDHQKREAIYGTLIQGKWNESETFEYRHSSTRIMGCLPV